MENRPVITINGRSPTPWADAQAYKRFHEWGLKTRAPIIITFPQVAGHNRYDIVREDPEYPQELGVTHYKHLKDWKADATTAQRAALGEDYKLWIDRGVIDYVWSAVYALLKSFRSKPDSSGRNEDTRIENASIMRLEAYRLSPEEQEKYASWFGEYGCTIFMPLFMKLPGLMGYDFYEHTGLRQRDYIVVQEYPRYLSIIYFENIGAYEGFMKSPELAGFHKAMRSIFPRGLRYEWHVQYQLVQSWRK